MNLRRLECTLTNRCNSQCIYCQADASPLRNEVMSPEDVQNYLAEASSVSQLESFLVFGGEPMLYPDLAISAFAKAHQLRVRKIDMLTNGTWGKDREETETLARKLKAAGLNVLGISVDAFHLEHIPLEFPRNAAMASVKAGIDDVAWNVAVLESLTAANKYDRKTAEILEELEPVGIKAHVHRVIPVGRAVTSLRSYFQQESVYGPCGGDPILENAPADPNCITIEPSGDVDICWDLAIGNAKQKPLNWIIREYDWREHPTIKTLVEEGPMSLVRDVEKSGFRFQESRYINKCHLCIEVRKALKKPQA